jgi:hypothetical protein
MDDDFTIRGVNGSDQIFLITYPLPNIFSDSDRRGYCSVMDSNADIPACGFELEMGWTRTGNKNSQIYALIDK